MGAETAEMLLWAEDRPPPPAGRGRAPLGSGLGGPRRRHSGLGEAALSTDGPQLGQEGDSTRREEASAARQRWGAGEQGGTQGPGGSRFPIVSA